MRNRLTTGENTLRVKTRMAISRLESSLATIKHLSAEWRRVNHDSMKKDFIERRLAKEFSRRDELQTSLAEIARSRASRAEAALA